MSSIICASRWWRWRVHHRQGMRDLSGTATITVEDRRVREVPVLSMVALKSRTQEQDAALASLETRLRGVSDAVGVLLCGLMFRVCANVCRHYEPSMTSFGATCRTRRSARTISATACSWFASCPSRLLTENAKPDVQPGLRCALGY